MQKNSYLFLALLLILFIFTSQLVIFQGQILVVYNSVLLVNGTLLSGLKYMDEWMHEKMNVWMNVTVG